MELRIHSRKETPNAESLLEESENGSDDLLVPREWYEEMLDSAVLQATGRNPDDLDELRNEMNQFLKVILENRKKLILLASRLRKTYQEQ
jgi:hypothetical protein